MARPKLCLNLNDKRNYIVHHKVLKYYLSKGLKLTKIHWILHFSEAPWMAPYVNKNTQLRKQAKTDFEKDFFKLMNNSVFGKTMENPRNRIDMRLTVNDDKKKKLIKNPRFKATKDFNDVLSAFLMVKYCVNLDKPSYIGAAILDLAKLVMYLRWDEIKEQYSTAQQLYTDTDSFVVLIETKDVYEEMNLDNYDTSNYPEDHPCYSLKNKKVPGLLKDEMGGKVISGFAVTRSKSYAIQVGDTTIKRLKGVKKSAIRDLGYDNYKNCILNATPGPKAEINIIGSDLHLIRYKKFVKKTLSAFDDKHYYYDSITSYAYGHYKIK